MKFYPKLGIYKSSNLTFCPEENKAFSYKWYQLLGHIKKTLVLNTFAYSPTTGRHISKLRKVLDNANIKYTTAQIPEGLQSASALTSAIDFYKKKSSELNLKISKARRPMKYHEELIETGSKLLFLKQCL